jgi:hypothetical protein
MLWRESRRGEAFSPTVDRCVCQSQVKSVCVAAACRGFPMGLMGMTIIAI